MALTRPNAAQVNFDVTNITDPLIRLNSNQSGTNDKDIGIVFERGSDTNVAIMWDESVNQLVIVNTTETGNTSGNVTISSYADIKANAYYGDGSNLTGISSYTDSDVATYLSNNGYGTSSSIIASITDSAPSTLDTLNELAAALGDDANFSTTVTNSLATKAPLASPALTGTTTAENLDVTGTLSLTGSDISFVDQGGTFPTDSGGFFWNLNNDEARIYAQQPLSDDINFYFKLSDNNNADDRFIFWIDDYRGGSYDRYPIVAHGEHVYFNSTESSSGVPNLSTAGAKIAGGTIELNPGSTAYNPTGGGTGTDTATDVAVAFPSGSRIVGTNDGYIRTIIEWNSAADIEIGQGSTSLIGGINLLPGSSGSAKVNGNRILTTADEGTGNGLDADTVDGIQASSFLRSDADDTKTGNIVLQTSGAVSNSTTGLFFEVGGSYTDGRYRTRFRKQDVGGGIPLYIDQSSGSANSYTAQARFGTYSGNNYEFEVFGDIKANGNVDATGVFNGTATSSQYADLAEKYLADAEYPIGTVLEIGGDAEVTIASPDSYKIVGTISEKPGLLMNNGLEGEHVVPVAYIGRVPCRVQGTIDRGDFLVVGNTPGVAVAKHPRDIVAGQAIGKALESYNSNNEGIIEILVGRL